MRAAVSWYSEMTIKPLIDYYTEKGVLAQVDGTQEIDKVFSDIVAILGE